MQVPHKLEASQKSSKIVIDGAIRDVMMFKKYCIDSQLNAANLKGPHLIWTTVTIQSLCFTKERRRGTNMV